MESYVERRITNLGIIPKRLVFIVNVGKYNNGRTYMGSDANAGFHWTLAVYDSESHKISYGDSLGWELLNIYLDMFNVYIN